MDSNAESLQQFAAGLIDEQQRMVHFKEPIILVTTVDIGGGNSDRIEVRRGDDPHKVALAFCAKHGLPENVADPLTSHIVDHLNKAKSPNAKSVASEPDARRSQSSGSNNLGLPPQQPPPQTAPLRQPQPSYGSFNNGLDERMQQQLQAKLMSVDDPARRAVNGNGSNFVNTTEVLSGSGSIGNSKRQPNPAIRGMSADPSPRGSVHLRLYNLSSDRAARLVERKRLEDAEAEAELRRAREGMSCISSKLMEGRGASGMYDNYGEMLYAEGVEGMLMRSKKAEAERKSREDKELDGVTFAPTITRKAWELKCRESTDSGDRDEKWRRLHERGMRTCTKERLEQLRKQREVEQLQECTFRPEINKKSDSLMTERAETLKVLNISHYDQLFQDALRRQAKMEELQRWYPDDVTFQPQVNKDKHAREMLRRSYEKMASSKSYGSGSGAAMRTSYHAGAQQSRSFGAGGPDAPSPRGSDVTSVAPTEAGAPPAVVERLYAQYERSLAKKEELQQRYAGSVDPDTGKPLFKPETGRAPRSQVRNKDNQPIGEYLYRVAQDMAARKHAQEEEEWRAAQEEASKKHTTSTSDKLFAQLKAKRVKQIFSYLDEQEQGAIDLVALVGVLPAEPSPAQLEAAAEGRIGVRSQRVDNLDNEVLLDVEMAAVLWARAHGMDAPIPAAPASTSSYAGSAPSSPGAASGPAGRGGFGHFPPTVGDSSVAPPPLNLQEFAYYMEQAIALRPRPRAYLVPSPAPKAQQHHSFRPQINKRSKQMAAKLRPADRQLFEVLHETAATTRERLDAKRVEQADAELASCTFQPQLNQATIQNVQGRALSRAGSKAYPPLPMPGAMLGGGSPATIALEQTLRMLRMPSGNAGAAAQAAGAANGGHHEAAAALQQQQQAEARSLEDLETEEFERYEQELFEQELLDAQQDVADTKATASVLVAIGSAGGVPTPAAEGGSRRMTKDGGGQQQQPAASTGTGSSLMDLAQAMSTWDHTADPHMASVSSASRR